MSCVLTSDDFILLIYQGSEQDSDATTDDESLGPILRPSQPTQMDSQRSAMSWEGAQKNTENTQKSTAENLFDELGL